jgi:hypothetical protein
MPEVDKKEVSRTIIEEQEWQQPRIGSIYEVQMDDDRLKYNVQVTDVGRPAPFIDQFFSSEEAARGLLEKVMKQSGGSDLEETIQEAPKKTKKSSTVTDIVGRTQNNG